MSSIIQNKNDYSLSRVIQHYPVFSEATIEEACRATIESDGDRCERLDVPLIYGPNEPRNSWLDRLLGWPW